MNRIWGFSIAGLLRFICNEEVGGSNPPSSTILRERNGGSVPFLPPGNHQSLIK